MSRIIIWDKGRHGVSVFAAGDDTELESSARRIVTILDETFGYIYDPGQEEPPLTDEAIEATRLTLADWPSTAARSVLHAIEEAQGYQASHVAFHAQQARHHAAAREIAAGTFTGSAWDILQERSGGEYETYYLAETQ